MTHFLVSDTNPEGHRLEEILSIIRADMILRCGKIANDKRPEAKHVLYNNAKILVLLSDAIALAEDSTRILEKAFGPHIKGGPPRIGEP